MGRARDGRMQEQDLLGARDILGSVSLDLPVTIIPVDARPPSPAEVLKHNFKVIYVDDFASSLP